MDSESSIQVSRIAARLKAEMQKQGINSTELARKSGVLTSFLYDVMRGKSSNPSTIKLARVADALHINLSDLVSDRIGQHHAEFSENPIKSYLSVPYLAIKDGRIFSYYEENESCNFCSEWLKKSFSTVDAIRQLLIESDELTPYLMNGDTVLIDIERNTIKNADIGDIFIGFDGKKFSAQRISQHRDIPDYDASTFGSEIVGRVVLVSRVL